MDYATFATTKESTYVASLTSIHSWVGVTDAAVEGVFKNYNDGRIVTSVLNWQSGEPNNALGKEHCVIIKNGAYNDLDCERFKRVLCEMNMNLRTGSLIENLVEVEPPSNLFSYLGTSGIPQLLT